MAINYNNDPYNQGLGNLDVGNMQTAGAYDSPTEGEYGFNLIELDRLKDAGYDPEEVGNYKNREDVQNLIRSLEPTANANNIMTDAYVNPNTPEISSGIMQMLNKQQNYEPQYRIRDQLNRDFLQGGIYRDAKQSLGQTKDALFEDFSGLTEGLGSIKNKYFDPAFDKIQGYGKKGIDLGKMAVSGIGNMIMPGLGYVLNAVKRPDYPSDAMSKSFAYGNQNAGNDYGYYNQLRHGNLTGQDQFGINTVSQFGNYPGYYDQYAQDYRAGKYSPTSKFAANKYAHAQEVAAANQARIERDFFTNDDSDGGGEVTYTPPATTNNGGGGNNYGGATQSGGFDSGGFEQDGTGRQGYGRGGIASL